MVTLLNFTNTHHLHRNYPVEVEKKPPWGVNPRLPGSFYPTLSKQRGWEGSCITLQTMVTMVTWSPPPDLLLANEVIVPCLAGIRSGARRCFVGRGMIKGNHGGDSLFRAFDTNARA